MAAARAAVAAVLVLAACRGEAPPIFTDEAAASGLVFAHDNGMTGRLYFAENVGSGAALLDYDGDGDLDVYLVQGHLLALDVESAPPGAGDRLFRNDLLVDGEGARRLRFVDVTERSGIDARGYGIGVATGDVEGDGDVDLYVANFGANELWSNRGDGTFENTTARAGVGDPNWSISALFTDVDGDGRLDLYVANYVDYRLATDRPCMTPTGAHTYCGPVGYRPSPDRLFRGLGDGRFEDVTARSGVRSALGKGLGVASGDVEGDGRIDLYVGNDLMPNFLWLNQGDGRFEDQASMAGAAVNSQGLPEASMGVVFADLDNDADEDLFLTHLTGETNTLYRNEDGAYFEDVTSMTGLGPASLDRTGFGAAALDYDNDGRLDLVVANGAIALIEEQVRAGDPNPLKQSDQLFRNLGGGRFADLSAGIEALVRPAVGRGLAVGDVDNDGDIDVVVQNNDGPAELLINRIGQDGPWWGLDPRPSLEAAGLAAAPLESATAAGPLLQRFTTDGSYGSARDPRRLFGGVAVEGGAVRLGARLPRRFEGLRAGRYYVIGRAATRGAPGP